MAKANDRSAKDKQMAARLRADGVERRTGICCICRKTVALGRASEAHYGAHARGAESE